MLTAAQVAPLFPGANPADIRANLPPLLTWLRKRQMDDAEMTAMTIASVRVESAGFKPVREYPSKYNTSAWDTKRNRPKPGAVLFDLYEPGTRIGRKLGNRKKGDGKKYRGAGKTQLTGYDNNVIMGRRENLPLAENPDLLMDPEVDAQVMTSFLKRDERDIRAALRAGDLRKARRLYNGGSHGLDVFRKTYHAAFAMLDGPRPVLPPKPPAEKQPPAVTDMPKREATATDVAKGPGAAAVAVGAGAGGIEQAQAELADAHGWLAGVSDYLDWLQYPLIAIALGLAGLAIWRIVRRR